MTPTAPKRLQCKHIPDEPVLRFLAAVPPGTWAGWWDYWPTVRDGMPPGTPDKLVLGKMRMLLRRGLVSGCPCGCRGDFVITDKGRAFLAVRDAEGAHAPT